MLVGKTSRQLNELQFGFLNTFTKTTRFICRIRKRKCNQTRYLSHECTCGTLSKHVPEAVTGLISNLDNNKGKSKTKWFRCTKPNFDVVLYISAINSDCLYLQTHKRRNKVQEWPCTSLTLIKAATQFMLQTNQSKALEIREQSKHTFSTFSNVFACLLLEASVLTTFCDFLSACILKFSI